MYIAVKMDCFAPRSTECKTFEYFQEVEQLGSEWLVFDGSREDGPNRSHVQLAFDDETGRHLARPW